MKKLDKLPLPSVGSKMFGLEVMHMNEIFLLQLFVFVTVPTLFYLFEQRMALTLPSFLWLLDVICTSRKRTHMGGSVKTNLHFRVAVAQVTPSTIF